MDKKNCEINKPFYDYSLEYDISHLPNSLKENIHELEKYDKNNDWLSYDLKFDELEISAKSYLINNKISEYDYKMILEKYGGLYD